MITATPRRSDRGLPTQGRPASDRDPRDGRRGALIAAVTAMVAAAVAPAITPIFGGGGGGWLILAASIPAAVALVSLWTRMPRDSARFEWRLLVAAGAIAGELAVLPRSPTDPGTLSGLGSGAARLLTGAIPLDPAGPELGAAVVATALTAFLAGEWSRRNAGLSLAPPVVLYIGALLAGGGGPAPASWATAVLVAAVAAVLLMRQLTGPETSGRHAGPARVRQVTGGLVAAGILVAVAVPLGSVLPGATSRAPYDLRAAIRPAARPANPISPLVSFAATYDAPVQPEFAVKVTGADPTELYWRLATFEHFDGTAWSSSASYERAGTTLPIGPRLSEPVAKVTATVDMITPSDFLPAPDRPITVSVAGLDVSGDGALAVDERSSAPRRFTVVSEVPEPSVSQLLASTPAVLHDPGSPSLSSLVREADTIMSPSLTSPFARLSALSTYLTGPIFQRHPPGNSPIGSGLYQVNSLLSSHEGSAEQFAGTFALLARSIGYQTRLAVGYQGGTTDAQDGMTVFTNRNLTVWPEVYLNGLGWTPFPASPLAVAGEGTPHGSASTGGVAGAIAKQDTDDRQHPKPSPAGTTHRERRAVASGIDWALWVAAAGLAVAALGAVLAGAKITRAWRQKHRRDPQRRLDGAWESTLDRLVEVGVPITVSLSTSEVAQRCAVLGSSCSELVSGLGRSVDASRYDRRQPSTPHDADAAWATAIQLRRAVRRSVPPARRVRAVLSAAPLRRGSHSPNSAMKLDTKS